MASSTRMAVALVVGGLLVVLVGLFALGSSDDDGNTGGGEPAMRATLTNDGCTFDGDTSPTTGVFIIDVENQTEFSGSFVLYWLAEGSTVDDLQMAIERARDPPEPSDYEFVEHSRVEAGATSALPANVSAGTYAVLCFVDDVRVPIEEVYVAEQLDVTRR